MFRRWYQEIDWPTVFGWAGLICVGLTAIYSATHGPASEFLLESVQQNFSRQLQWFGICVALFGVLLLTPGRVFERAAYPIYGVALALCIATALFGREVNGAKAWLYVGPFGFQIGELAKYGTLLAVARFISTRPQRARRLRDAAIATALIIVPAVVILGPQNDTGTALVFFALIPIVFFWGGVPLPVMAIMMAPAVAAYLAIVDLNLALIFAAVAAIAMLVLSRNKVYTAVIGVSNAVLAVAVNLAITKVLQPHQVDRIVAFADPERFRLTSGFHVIQAKAAIGQGGLFGRGFMQGTQTQLAFIPEQSTDFIFCVIGEEFGFLGAAVVLGLYAFVLIRLATLGTWAGHVFPKVFAAGVAGIFLVHVIINVGMTIGVMPVIGIPLPLISYGGSALLANTLLVGTAVSQFVGRTVTQAAEESGIEFARQLGSLVAGLILFVVGIMAIAQLRFDTDMVRIVTICTLSGLALAFGLSVGLGTRDITRNVLAGFYARKIFRPGAPIEIRGHRGVLRAITATQTLIDQETGLVSVANSVFLDETIRH